jgi:hypothetical protein
MWGLKRRGSFALHGSAESVVIVALIVAAVAGAVLAVRWALA